MKKIAIYSRVSTGNQTTDNQIFRLTEYCKAMNWEFEVFEETQSTREVRPVKRKLLSELKKHKYSGVLVYKLDRWARSTRELILEVNELVNHQVGFYSYCENLDFSTASGKLHFAILSAFAEFEREIIRERTLEGIARAKREGKTLGRPKGLKDKKERKTDGYLKRWNPGLKELKTAL